MRLCSENLNMMATSSSDQNACIWDLRKLGESKPEPLKLITRGRVVHSAYFSPSRSLLATTSLPRLLTGSILAHEMMHAWFRLKGFSNLPPNVEDGICQVLGHMCLDSEIMAGSGSTNVASISPSSSSVPVPESSKKGKRSFFEKQLGEFFKHQIESDSSA